MCCHFRGGGDASIEVKVTSGPLPPTPLLLRSESEQAGSRARWLGSHASSATYQCGSLEGMTQLLGFGIFSCKKRDTVSKQATYSSLLKAARKSRP